MAAFTVTTRGMPHRSKTFTTRRSTPVTLSWGCRYGVYRRSLRGNIAAKRATSSNVKISGVPSAVHEKHREEVHTFADNLGGGIIVVDKSDTKLRCRTRVLDEWIYELRTAICRPKDLAKEAQ